MSITRRLRLPFGRTEPRPGPPDRTPEAARDEIRRTPGYREGVSRLARELDRSEADIEREASEYLEEMVSGYSRRLLEVSSQLARYGYRLGYEPRLHYEPEQIERLRELMSERPIVVLPSHKSYVDTLVIRAVMAENELPPTITVGGINMAFWPFGPLIRRMGGIWLRRTFRDNHVYKLVLREYVGNLVEHGYHLEWYIEGGRSRSGKLLPPRLGMLKYLAAAYRQGRRDDVMLVPVSIVYDQLHDVSEYEAFARGGEKQAESLRWAVRYLRAQRARFGEIYIGFGEPLALRETLGPPVPRDERDPEEESLALQKTAFEVSVRINRVTPITPTALVTLVLLGVGDRALTLEQVLAALIDPLADVRRRRLPMTTTAAQLDTAEGTRRTLEALMRHGVVSCFDEGPEPVYGIGTDHHVAASYYRNTVIHFFGNGAIAELALLRAADPESTDRTAEFWDEAMRLRDLLKFEFFFPEKDEFRAEVASELTLQDPAWEKRLDEGPDEIRSLVEAIRPLSAHTVLGSFLDAYGIVADALAARGARVAFEEQPFLEECLGLGRQYLLQRRIRSPESVSQLLFGTALQLARNRDLVEPVGDAVAERRVAFAEEMRDARARVEVVAAIAAERSASLVAVTSA